MATRNVLLGGMIFVLAVGCGGSEQRAGEVGDARSDVVEVGPGWDVLAPDAPDDPGSTDTPEPIEDAAETSEADVSPPPPPLKYLEPPPLVLEAFNVVVETPGTLGVPGQEFPLMVRLARGTPDGDLSYAWTLDGASVEGATGSTWTAKPLSEGRHTVAVTATDSKGHAATGGVILWIVPPGPASVGDVDGDGDVDADDVALIEAHLDGTPFASVEAFERADVDLDGRVSTVDLELVQSAVNVGARAPVHLSSVEGAPGKALRLIHPALLDPTNSASILFPGALPVVPVRVVPGHAAFVVPPDATVGDGGVLSLSVNGEVVDTFAFSVLPLPVLLDAPGVLMNGALHKLDTLVQRMPDLIEAIRNAMEIPAEEGAVLDGLIALASGSFSLNQAAFLEAFDAMEPEGKAAFEQVALANGLDELVERMDAIAVKLALRESGFRGPPEKPIGIAAAATLIDLICTAREIADISSKVAQINEIAAGYIAWFDWWPLNTLPVVGQVINFLNSISNAIGTITDIVAMVGEYLPEFGRVKASATPASIGIGQDTKIAALLEIIIATKLCLKAGGAAVESLMDRMTDLLTRRLAASIPLVNTAFKKAAYEKERMGWVMGLVYDAISAAAGKILDLLGIQGLLEGLVEKICGLLKDPFLPIDPSFLKASCGTAKAGAWPCTEPCVGSVSFAGETEYCGEKKAAQTSVECKGCGPDQCSGCCDAQTCLGFPQQSDAKCGTGGVPCAPCPTGFACVDGKCECHSDCTTEGEVRCGDSLHVEACTLIANEPECLKWKVSKTCENGNTCQDGECTGGCNGSNCQGCCVPSGNCIDPPTDEQCGKGGETCYYCMDGHCVQGECVTNVCCKMAGPTYLVMTSVECAAANGKALPVEGCEQPCGGEPPTNWRISYGGSGFGTYFVKWGPEPEGTYSSDCYGVIQTCEVYPGEAADTYVVDPENKCFSFPVDSTKNCIYCSDDCPKGHTVTVVRDTLNTWVGKCGPYTVTLRANCP